MQKSVVFGKLKIDLNGNLAHQHHFGIQDPKFGIFLEIDDVENPRFGGGDPKFPKEGKTRDRKTWSSANSPS